MDQEIKRRKQPMAPERRRHTFMLRMEPTLWYQLKVLAEHHRISIASIATEGIKYQVGELEKANDVQATI